MLNNSGLATLGDIVEANGAKAPSRVALTYQGRDYSYGEHRSRIYRLANALFAQGVRRQRRVAVLAQNSNAYIEIYAAGEVAGYITVAVNYRLASAEIEYILKDSAPDVLIFDEEYSEIVGEIRSSYPDIRHYICVGHGSLPWADNYEMVIANASDAPPLTRARPSDIAYLIYTSGTTGRPKGAMLDHAGQLGFIQSQATDLSIRSTDTMLLTMPFYHIGAKCNFLTATLVGGRVVLHRSYDIESITADITRYQVSVIHLAPIMVKDLIELPGLKKN